MSRPDAIVSWAGQWLTFVLLGPWRRPIIVHTIELFCVAI
jgi:hypothetical protein